MAIRAAPEGLPMVAFTGDAGSLDAAKFSARHGNAFLILLSSASRTTAPGVVEVTGNMRVMVFPVVRLPTSTRDGVTIGRGTANDIVVKDDTLSKLHATFTVANDAFSIIDEGSTNGSAVQGIPVPARGKGAPTTITPGQTIRCGTVTFNFVNAEHLIDLCRRFRGSYS